MNLIFVKIAILRKFCFLALIKYGGRANKKEGSTC